MKHANLQIKVRIARNLQASVLGQFGAKRCRTLALKEHVWTTLVYNLLDYIQMVNIVIIKCTKQVSPAQHFHQALHLAGQLEWQKFLFHLDWTLPPACGQKQNVMNLCSDDSSY